MYCRLTNSCLRKLNTALEPYGIGIQFTCMLSEWSMELIHVEAVAHSQLSWQWWQTPNRVHICQCKGSCAIPSFIILHRDHLKSIIFLKVNLCCTVRVLGYQYCLTNGGILYKVWLITFHLSKNKEKSGKI